MSSSFVVESLQSGSKKDDTLIIVVNDDGTISVDQETLQNLIMNQSDANVSVVRVGQSEGDAENGDLTLTVDPPAFERTATESTTVTSAVTSDVTGLVDPFMEMDPEQLEKLETALQSEQAKQILGENVTAMLDMLTVEEQQKSIKYCIELDHCYTSRSSPTDPEPSDALPIANSPDIDDFEYKQSSQQPSIILPNLDANVADAITTPVARPKLPVRNATTRTMVARGRKIAVPVTQPTTGIPKSPPAVNSRNSSIVQQSPNRAINSNVRVDPERREDEPTSSSESSESEPPSDDDSDFGPRGPRRGGVRARGGRKGLTTRGGSTTATRRRSSNKQMDMDLVRRLDIEMAAAVDAMKSPEKPDRPERFNPARAKKRSKSFVGKKKDDVSLSQAVANVTSSPPPPSAAVPSAVVNEPTTPMIIEKPLQTTNQVKANLINANMIKGDMILTKPGQGRNNQKVMFVQKRLLVRPNEMKNLGIKRQSIVIAKGGKTLPLQIQTKLGTSEEGKLVSVSGKTISPIIDAVQQQPKTLTISPTTAPIISSASLLSTTHALEQQQQPPRVDSPTCELPQQLLQQEETTQDSVKDAIVAPSSPIKVKTAEVKREKRKSESEFKFEEASKPVEPKTPDASKKHVKKEQRKSPAVLADTLGPALFSTPDIIRRVGSEARSIDIPGTPTIALSTLPNDFSSTSNSPLASSDLVSLIVTPVKSHGEISAGTETQILRPVRPSTDSISFVDSPIENQPLPSVSSDSKSDSKVPTAEELEPSLDPAKNSPLTADTPELKRSTDVPVVPNEIVSEQSGIEGEEHLLATLEMEANKPEEELLAEALLLQEELGVDIADHATLAESAGSLPESLLSTSTSFETPMEQTEKRRESSTKPPESVKSTESTIVVAPIVPSVPVAIATAVSPKLIVETPKKRDEKEPIQIIRGGRVITLPPIEAPATRSKRLQVKPETPQKSTELPKKDDKIVKQLVQQPQQQQHHQRTKETDEMGMDVEIADGADDDNDNDIPEDNDDDYEDDDDENSDSEDDPDRLWCICKRPHNNRFMICCDVCEDWFHGKCVHVSKAMGQQMEEKGIEWVCPNCVKKKDQGANSEQKKLQSGPGKISSKAETDNSSKVVTAPRPSVSSSERVRKPNVQPVIDTPPPVAAPNALSVTQCIVCKKEARNSSIFCSDACILAHAQETRTRDIKTVAVVQTKIGTSDAAPRSSTDARVIVFEKRTGKVLTGIDAPTTSNLKTWLKENPTFEVVRPNNLNTLQIGGKTVTAIQTQGVGKLMKVSQGTSPTGQTKMIYTKVMGSKQTVLAPSNKKLVVLSGGQQRLSPKTIQQKQQVSLFSGKNPVMRQTTIKVVSQSVKSPTTTIPKQTIVKKQETTRVASTAQQQQQQQQKPIPKTLPVKRAEPEPIRLNVRNTLAELLTTRIRDSQDLSLTEDEINELALNIELELYKYFRDTGAKYKSKYRSLVFNIKDTKNLTLFRKIADRSLTPDAVVRLSPDEMASQELAEWREKETKHQLEMIKKNELDLMAQTKSIVVKTHKGELIIESEGGMDHVDPKTPVQDIVTALNSHEVTSEENKDESNKAVGGQSLVSEDSKKSKVSITTATTTITDDRKKKDRERAREKERGDSKGSTKTIEKDGSKVTRLKGIEEEERRRSHSRGRNRRSRDRERSRDRRSTKSKESKRDSDKDIVKDRERHKSGKESRQRDKDRQRRSRGSNKEHRNRNNRDEESGRGSKRETGDRKLELLGQQMGSSEAEKPIEDRLWRHIEEETTTTMTTPTTTMTMTSSATTNSLIFDGNDSDVSDREPSSTVNIKTPDINDESEREKDVSQVSIVGEAAQLDKQQNLGKVGTGQTVWRGFVNMVDVAKFFITAQEVSGQAKDLMEDLPDTVDVVGRISHETVWDYISKMKKTGSKEILVIRLTAANDEEKIPYITLYSYLNSRSRLGVVGNVSKNIKDFYIMPFSRQSQIPAVLLPLIGPGFEDQRPHLLLGIIVRNKRKRVSSVAIPTAAPPSKIIKKEEDDTLKGKKSPTNRHHHHHHHHHQHQQQSPPDSPRPLHKGLLLESLRERQTAVTQMTLESLNKAHVGMSRTAIIDNATISKLVPELSSKIDLCDSPKGATPPPQPASTSPTTVSTDDIAVEEEDRDDGDEPYSPGGATDVDEPDEPHDIRLVKNEIVDIAIAASSSSVLSPNKNSTELQRKMDELNRQIEEQKQQIQSISSSFLGDATTTLPGLGLDPPEVGDMDEAYSPTDARSFTPPPPGIAKFAQPILDKVSDITIPPNLQEILANVKRQESSKIDPYLPSKPSATFLTSSNPSVYPTKPLDKYTPTFINKNSGQTGRAAAVGVAPTSPSPIEKSIFDNSPSSMIKETKSTLRSLSDLDLIKKAEEELAAVAAVSVPAISPQTDSQSVPIPPSFTSPPPPLPPPPPPLPPTILPNSAMLVLHEPTSENIPYASPIITDSERKSSVSSSISLEQPKPPGLEDEDMPVIFPTTSPSSIESMGKATTPPKFVPKSGVVLCVKRKVSDDGGSPVAPNKAPRTKSRWGQGPAE